MRIGLAGVGRIGVHHADALAGLAAVDELVLADADLARSREAAARLVGAGHNGVWAADSVDALFAAALDGLVVAAPTDTHAGLIVRAVEAGLPVFCEKPVAPDLDGTLEVLRRTASSVVPVQIGFQRRFDAGYAAARQAVRSGALGRVHTVRATTGDVAPPPDDYIPTSGGLFRDCSVHDFDILRWVTGREVVEVYARGSARGAAVFAASGDVAAGAAMLTLDDDSTALVSATRYNGAGHDVRFEVLGSEGSIAVGLDDATPLRSAEPGVTFPPGPAHASFMARFRPAYERELAAFVQDVVAAGGPATCTLQDGLEAFYVAEACELSRAERRPVTIDEVRQ